MATGQLLICSTALATDARASCVTKSSTFIRQRKDCVHAKWKKKVLKVNLKLI